MRIEQPGDAFTSAEISRWYLFTGEVTEGIENASGDGEKESEYSFTGDSDTEE